MDAGVEVCMTTDEEKQQHMDASPPSPHCRESSRRSNPVGARLRSEKPPGPAPWRHQHCQRAAGKRPRVSPPPPPGSRGGATSLPGVRPRIRFREPASTTSKKQDIMGVFLLWPRTSFPPHPPPLPSCFCYMAMVAGGSQRRRVLLVEDNEVNRVVVRRLTREMGMGLEEAENGRVAVELIRQGRAYDLIFMDKEMPVMDGHEATRQLRSLGVTTPIVALSGNTLQSDRDSFLEAGADHFEAKPLSRGQFMKILTKYGLHQL